MHSTLRLLVQLQQIDTIILEKRRVIEAAPLKISSADKPVRDARSELEKSIRKSETLLSFKREKERLLEETNNKILKLKARSSDIKTNKEYHALNKEIESCEKEIEKIEEALLKIIYEIGAVDNEINNKRNLLVQEENRLKEISDSVNEDIALLRRELSDLKKERAELAVGLPADIYNNYLDLLMKGRGMAVSLVEDEICLGCNMNIPPQLFVQVRKGSEILHCPQCDRILYCKAD